MSNPLRTASLIFIAAFSVLSLSSCGNQKEVSFKSGGMTQTFAEGQDAIPKDFPLPIYPGATTSGSVSAGGEDQEHSQFLMLSSNDSMDKISEFYQGQLKDKGWEIDKVDTSPKLVSIDAHKDKLQANAELVEDSDSDKTTISLQVSQQSDNPKEDSEAAAENFKPDKVTPPTD
ncbi:MAG: hypothetical protein U0103_07955 [Candidatus Obscuribacterales bacterium]|nr:hypothetical protein [Cyanobacteria bacterium SZAS LIN-5]RTL39285.1 MAG: hypothetical protein EKK48_19775 [Candidatus Melainabacteria bacterium]